MNPAYEGWIPNADGSFTLVFGYMNANWQQEFDIPIGPQNAIEPGGPDQGQPTHFYPRRNPFLFSIRVPADFGSKELIWTLTANGKTEKAYASLKADYQIDPQVISTEVGGDFGSLRDELRTNIPPELSVAETKRSVKIGEPVSLVAVAKDPDNIPARRGPPKPLPGRADADDLCGGAVSPAVVDRRHQRPGFAFLVDRLSRQRSGGHVHARSDEDVDRHPRVCELAVVAAVDDSAAAHGQQVADAGHVQRAGHVRPPRRRERRIALHLRERDGDRQPLTTSSSA